MSPDTPLQPGPHLAGECCPISPGPQEGDSRVAGASSSSCSGNFLNSERSVCSSWETASWARQAASGGGALLGAQTRSEGLAPQQEPAPQSLLHTPGRDPQPLSAPGGPSRGSGDRLHSTCTHDRQVGLWSSCSWTAIHAVPFMGPSLGLVGRGSHRHASCLSAGHSGQAKLPDVQPYTSSWSPIPAGDPWGLGSPIS